MFLEQIGWVVINNCKLPYIKRIGDGEPVRLISSRMVFLYLLNKFTQTLLGNAVKCIPRCSKRITPTEAKVLNDTIAANKSKTNRIIMMDASVDTFLRLDDIIEFYEFVKLIYEKLTVPIRFYQQKKCGFVRLDYQSVVPYIILDNKKYVPLIFFDGEIDELEVQTKEIKNWDYAYLKFCLRVQGIKENCYSPSSCLVANLEKIKTKFPSETVFEEYWPAEFPETDLFALKKSLNPYMPTTKIQISNNGISNALDDFAQTSTNTVVKQEILQLTRENTQQQQQQQQQLSQKYHQNYQLQQPIQVQKRVISKTS